MTTLKTKISDLQKLIAAIRAERRAQLIARFAASLTATVADARAFGYCQPGIEQFRRQYGLTGETATLRQLMQTGDRRAEALALVLARRAASRTITTATA